MTLRWGSAAILAGLAVAAAIVPAGAGAVLVNITPSEPIGLYQRTALAPAPGRLVAFPAPATAFPYADAHLGYLHRVPLLKRVAAGPGDQVCTTSSRVVINGRPGPVIAEVDHRGRALPHWRACRILGAGEFFALADRVPASFDSRYFGPVPRTSMIGVYRPLLLLEGPR